MIKWILSCVIICLAVLLVRQIFRKKLSPKLQYMLWGFVLIRLLIPFDIGHSRFSVANLFPAGSEEVAGYEESLKNGRLADEDLEYANLAYENLEGVDLEASEFGNEGYGAGDFGAKDFAAESLGVMNPATDGSENLYTEATSTAVANRATSNIDTTNSAAITDGFKLFALIGSLFMGILFLLSYLHLGRKLRHNRISCTRDTDPLSVYLTNAVNTPCLFGLFSPAIYLPEEYSDIPDARTHAVMHEWVHFRHRDHIWALLRTLCLVFHWYNPFVWMSAKCSVTDAELACDADTIRILGEDSRKSYGNTLISLTDRGNPSLLFSATAMSSTKKQLKERIQMIVKKPKKNRIVTCVALSFCMVVGGMTFLGAGKQSKDLPTKEEGIADLKSYVYSKITEIPNDLNTDDPFLYNPPVEDTLQDQLVVEEVKPFTLILTDNDNRGFKYTYRVNFEMSKYWINESDVCVGRILYPLYDPGKYNHCFDMDPELADQLGETYYMFGAKGNVTCPESFLGDEEKKEAWREQIGSSTNFATFRKSENVNIMRYNNQFTIDQSLRDDTDCDELESNGYFKAQMFLTFAKELWTDMDVREEGTDTYITDIERMPILYNEAGDQFVVYQVKYFNYVKADKKMGPSKSLYFLFHFEKVEDTYAAMYIRSETAKNMKDYQDLFVGDPEDEKYQSLLKTLTLDFESDRPDYAPAVDQFKEEGIKIEFMYNICNSCLQGYGTVESERNPYRYIPFHRDNGYWEPYDLSTLGEISE